MITLARAICRPGEIPTARQHMAVFNHVLANRLLKPVATVDDPDPMAHPWRVSVRRFEANKFSTLDPEKTWRVDVLDGCVNDTLASILYHRKDDPRGWQLPIDYAEEKPDTNFVERTALDDLDDPPFLVITDPPPKGGDISKADWTLVTDAQRLQLEGGAFCSGSDWDLELWRAFVVLSAAPLSSTLFPPTLPPPRLQKFRLFTLPVRPKPTFGTQAGGWLELATLYLLRDPADPHGSAEIRIRQREFFDFWAMAVTPGADLLTVIGDVGSDGFAGLIQSQIEQDVSGGTEALFWGV